MLKLLGKLGKGWGTVAGVLTTAAGIVAAFIGKDKGEALNAAVGAITSNLPTIITAVGGVVTVFSSGRKAGVHAAADALELPADAVNAAIKGDVAKGAP